ncbi:MAG: magnesium transporter [Lachnospiraceae bacterium]
MTEQELITLLDKRNYKEIKQKLEQLYPVDIAELLSELNERQLIFSFRLLGKVDAAETFTYMNSDMREILIEAMTDSELKEVMEDMYLDDTVDILEEMPANVVDRLLEATHENTRKRINEFLKYPEDSAGSIMTVEYVGLRQTMTVAESILKIRQVGINKETIYTCYVTDKKKLIGCVTMKDLLTSSDSRTIEEIMDTNILYVNTQEDQENVAKLTRKYGLMAIPVVDHEMCMVGIVTVDDAMLVLQEETTEDITIMAAVKPSERSYFGTSVWTHAKNRSLWLLVLMFSATITGVIITKYETALTVFPTLIAFIPMLMDTGGNCGSQSSTLIIRGIALDEIKFKDIFKVVFKEFRVALIVGVFLAIVNGIRIYIMNGQDVLLAAAIGMTLITTIMMAKLVGCSLPLCAKKIGLDPAIMAAPLITTLVDTGSIIIYFSIVTRMLHI